MSDDGYVCLFQVVFGKVWGFETRATDFLRSADGSEISFSCAGWCGGCGPVSGPIKLVHSVEFSKTR